MSNLFMEMQRHTRNRTIADSVEMSEDEPVMASATLDDDDSLTNILSLKLKKPKGWNWELTTSRSCSNIALPRIMLYDHKGQLLVDANSQQEQVYKQQHFEIPTAKMSRKQKRTNRAATANLVESIRRPALNREFSGLQIEEVTPSPEPPLLNGLKQMQRSRNESPASIEFQTTDLPDYKFERRSSSFKEVRFKVDKRQESSKIEESPYFHAIDLPTPPSTTTTTSSSGPHEKRRYRRSQSSSLGRSPATSESILERFSYTRGRFSSPEYIEEHNVEHSPRYFLRTSKAGTLVVKEESFSRYRRRHKPRNSSAENLQNEGSSKSRSSSCIKLPTSHTNSINELKLPLESPQSGSLQNVATRTRKKSFPVRRYRSDGNILRQQRSSSSSDTELKCRMNDNGGNSNGRRSSSRRYSDFRKQSKKG